MGYISIDFPPFCRFFKTHWIRAYCGKFPEIWRVVPLISPKIRLVLTSAPSSLAESFRMKLNLSVSIQQRCTFPTIHVLGHHHLAYWASTDGYNYQSSFRFSWTKKTMFPSSRLTNWCCFPLPLQLTSILCGKSVENYRTLKNIRCSIPRITSNVHEYSWK